MVITEVPLRPNEGSTPGVPGQRVAPPEEDPPPTDPMEPPSPREPMLPEPGDPQEPPEYDEGGEALYRPGDGWLETD